MEGERSLVYLDDGEKAHEARAPCIGWREVEYGTRLSRVECVSLLD